MSAPAPPPTWQTQLPIDLQQLVSLVCTDPFALLLASSSANELLTTSANAGTQPQTVRVALESATNKTCWGLLPVEWREYFDGVPVEDRDAVLRSLSVGAICPAFPTSLAAYLSTCTALSLNRTCSPHPILSTQPPNASDPPRPAFTPAASLVRTGNNALTAGLSPKKQHEVVNLACLADDILSDKKVRHAVDVGSGRAHLSRALARPPLDLHVLAVDWSASQTAGATRLDQVTATTALKSGSLTHTTNSLDAPAIQQVLQSWPVPSDDLSASPAEPALLVALHACGNLTPDSLRAFVADAQAQPQAPPRRMIAVGCCYNLMTPSTFPLSDIVRSFPEAVLCRDQLRISPQSPPNWHISEASTRAWKTSITKLAHRARLEAELSVIGLADGRNEEKRVGRLPDLKTYEAYRLKALEKFGVENAEEVPMLELEEDWEDVLWKLSVFWTIRCWVGPLVESLLAVDRWAFLVEGLGAERKVELVNVFEQSTTSLRNMALVVR